VEWARLLLLHDARRLKWGVWVEEPELLDSVLELQHAQDGAPLLELQQEVQKRVLQLQH
jgi:hypothetical protein